MVPMPKSSYNLFYMWIGSNTPKESMYKCWLSFKLNALVVILQMRLEESIIYNSLLMFRNVYHVP